MEPLGPAWLVSAFANRNVAMTRWRRWVVGVFVLIILCAAGVWFALSTRSVDPEVLRQRRQIAKACLSMLHSPLTNEMDISTDDPRVPQVIRDLRPVHIKLGVIDAVVMMSGSPAEYHLSRSPEDANTWILYAAGSGAIHSHRELLRIEE